MLDGYPPNDHVVGAVCRACLSYSAFPQEVSDQVYYRVLAYLY